MLVTVGKSIFAFLFQIPLHPSTEWGVELSKIANLHGGNAGTVCL
jgi:hypothetical protein